MKRIAIYIALAMVALGAWGQDSPLATGRWWRVKVTQSGMYSIGTADLPTLLGTEVSKIGLYGGNGLQMSTDNAQAPTYGLQPIAIEVTDRNGDGRFGEGDAVVFYGEGTDAWRFSDEDRQWEMQRHAYASANCYYLTLDDEAPLRIATAAPLPTTDTAIGSYTAVTTVNNDLVNIFESGQLWMGEKFSSAVRTRSFTLSLPATASDIKLRYALANKSSATGTFRIGFGSQSRLHYIAASTVYNRTLEVANGTAQTLTFNLEYTPGENGGEGYLDYIEMTGHVPLNYGGGQLTVRNDQGLGGATATFGVSGSGAGAMRVWDVSRAGEERALSVAGNGWSDSTAGVARTYILFSDASLRSPAAIVSLANQNLRGAEQTDYVVVCHSDFRQQATRLASLHAIVDGMSTLVVSDEEVYNEFSSGKQDPMAIRALMRHLRQRHGEEGAPRYLLLFGKSTYDNRDLLGHGLPTVVTYETVLSFDHDGRSYCSDDMLGYLDDDETGSVSRGLDIGIGRLPAKSADEANHLVDKIEGYMMRSDLQDEAVRGDWRHYVALLADDADLQQTGDTTFAHDAEAVATSIKQTFPQFNIDRLYADAYRQQSGAIGSYYPDLNNALRQRINYGCLLLNYIGHGSEKYIGTERYIEPSDVTGYTNYGRLPLLIASTCSYGYMDKPDEDCGAELFMHAQGGAVAVISAARPISHIGSFNTDLILFALDARNTIGDALRMAKNRTSVSPCIGLLGDPALRLARPMHNVVVTHIDGQAVGESPDTATVLSQVSVSGEIRDTAGRLLDDFEGTIYPIVFDRETPGTTRANDNPGTEVHFVQQKNVLYKGVERVSGGRFTYTFTVPRDIAYRYAPGKLSHYAKSGSEDAGGQYAGLLFGGLNEESQCSETRPTIHLYMGDTTFRDGGLTDENPTLLALLADSVGINAFGSGLGHDITVTLDGNAGSTTVLNDFYEADITDPLRGSVRYSFRDLAPGSHTLTLKAWNIWGYSSSASLHFRVRGADSTDFSQLTVSPNPASGRAVFHLQTNSPAAVSSATLTVYSAQGSPLFSVDIDQADGYSLGPVVWNLEGVAPGLYLARIVVTTTDGTTHQRTTKCIVTQ